MDLDPCEILEGVIGIVIGEDVGKERFLVHIVNKEKMATVDGQVLAVGFSVVVGGCLVDLEEVASVVVGDETRWTLNCEEEENCT